MELKDVIHYYLGQPCLNLFFPDGHEMRDCQWRLTGIREKSYTKPYGLENSENATWTDSIKPILRKLEDMREDEIWELSGLDGKLVQASNEGSFFQVSYILDGNALFTHWYKHHLKTEQLHYLLSHGFDLCNLIPSGQAIDATTINK